MLKLCLVGLFIAGHCIVQKRVETKAGKLV